MVLTRMDGAATISRKLSHGARLVFVPLLVTIGLLAIAVALVEGPALEPFLYAVF